MKKFDIKWFNEHKEEDSTLTKKGENGEILFYASLNDGYLLIKSSEYNPYYEIYKYSEEGSLIKIEKYFYECKIGKQLLFDSMGNSREGIDYDQPFKFSVEDVTALIKEKYDVDILQKSDSVSLARIPYDRFVQKPYYDFTISSLKTHLRKVVLIDETTGDILIEEERPLQAVDILHYKSIYQKYAEKQALSQATDDKKKGFWSTLFD